MGMSASQARLLSLQARMSDVEYEGQQINQQRLVLSNKMNEVMERMTNMDVPTPPSKQDFLYNEYTGKTRNGKKISAKMNDDGTFSVTKEVSGFIVDDSGLQNITNGAAINGEVLDPKEYIDGEVGKFRDVKDGETPNATRQSKATEPKDLTKYETQNYNIKYDKESGYKKFPASKDGYTKGEPGGKNYAASDSKSKIRIPKYNAKLSKTEGFYAGEVYLGTNKPADPVEGKKVGSTYLTKTDFETEQAKQAEHERTQKQHDEYLADQALPENQRQGKVDCTVTDKSEYAEHLNSATDAWRYNVYDSSKYSNDFEEKWFDQKLNIGQNPIPAEYDITQSSEWQEVTIDFGNEPGLTDDNFNTQVRNAINDKAVKNGDASNPERNNLVSGIDPHDEAKGVTFKGTLVTDYSQIREHCDLLYNRFEGEEKAGDKFDSALTYIKKNGPAYLEQRITGAKINEHNTKVEANESKNYFWMSGGKYVKISGKEASEKVKTGTAVYAEGGDQGMIDKTVKKDTLIGCYYFNDDNRAVQITNENVAQFAQNLLNNKGSVLRKSNGGTKTVYDQSQEGQVTVNGKKTKRLTPEVITEYDGVNLQNALSGLKHTFDYKGSGLSETEFYAQFALIIDDTNTPITFSFCKYDELMGNGHSDVDDQVRVYTPASGKYDETIESEEVFYDEDGYLQSVRLTNGEIVDMEVNQVVDEIEYDKAMNKYNIKKIEYDKEVNELNKQTSIYQRQDKQLELKLTRLDTERNALNTEIEAVKKVIQDATEKGFKTFSG